MKFDETLAGRRSIRKYESRSISRDLIFQLLEAAEMAPSAGNLRARRYFVVIKKEIRKVLAIAAYGQSQAEKAPLLIVICSDIERSRRRYGDRGNLYSIQDATVAAMCLLLKAYDLGLGACWIGAFDEDIVGETLNLDTSIVPVAIISLGWPAEQPTSPPKRQNNEVVSWIE
jgi:nitroreductase